jgi:hypothetical protein
MTTNTAVPLNEQYLDRLRHYDQSAIRRKAWYQWIWIALTVLTWLTLLLAILGTAQFLPAWSSRLVLQGLIPVFSSAVTVLTLAQTVLRLRGKWLAARAAAECLKNAGMLYRFGLPPYHQADADDQLRQTLGDLDARATQGQRFEWHYLFDNLFVLPPELRRDLRSTPDAGLLPRWAGAADGEPAVLEGRLQQQRQWYARKAQRYVRIYLAFQAALVVLGAFNGLYTLSWGREFVLVALTTTGSLGLIALRDFLDCGPLLFQYVQTAGALQEIEQAYLRKQPPFDQADAVARLRRLVEQVEQILSTELLYWRASRR